MPAQKLATFFSTKTVTSGHILEVATWKQHSNFHILKLDSSLNWEGLPRGSDSKESACNVGDLASIPGLGRPWRRKRQTTAVFLPGESHGLRSLAGYSPSGRKESDTTVQPLLHFMWTEKLVMAKIFHCYDIQYQEAVVFFFFYSEIFFHFWVFFFQFFLLVGV